jgi:hypothetical protein
VAWGRLTGWNLYHGPRDHLRGVTKKVFGMVAGISTMGRRKPRFKRFPYQESFSKKMTFAGDSAGENAKNQKRGLAHVG